jgi:uncharacterized protein (TIGR02118 family)
MKRWEELPELEGGTSIILIQRETFPLFGTQTELGFFEVDEGTASDLRVRGSAQVWRGVETQFGISQILFS